MSENSCVELLKFHMLVDNFTAMVSYMQFCKVFHRNFFHFSLYGSFDIALYNLIWR